MHFYSPKFFILSSHSLYCIHSVFSTERASVLFTILEMYHMTVAFVMLTRIDGYFILIGAFALLKTALAQIRLKNVRFVTK